jgi:hypothetical protein
MGFGQRRQLDEIRVTGAPTPFVLVNATPRSGVSGAAPHDGEVGSGLA